MRILQIVADGNPGGGTTIVLGLVEACLGAAMETHLLVQTGSYAAERGRALGATVHEADFFAGRFNRAAERRLVEVATAVQPDAIHVHGGRAAFFARRGLPAPTVYTVHGYHFLRKPPLLRILGLLAERRAARMAAEIVFVCHFDQELCERMNLAPRNTAKQVIFNGVRVEDLGGDASPEPKRIAFLGRLTEQKDPGLAVATMAQLATEGYRMEMIGGGEMESEVRAEISQRGLDGSVSISGAVKREEALAKLRRAEAMLMTSEWEGLPVAVLEAMAIGVPVVASRVSGIPEIIEDGVDGVLVDSRDPADFAEGVRSLEGRRQGIVAAAREKIERQFLWRDCAARHLELYRRLADRT